METAEVSDVKKANSGSVGGSRRKLHKINDNEDENCNDEEVLEDNSVNDKCVSKICEVVVLNGNSVIKEDSNPDTSKMEDLNDKDEKPNLPAGATDIDNQIINCTACGHQINHKSFCFEKHPILEVIMCKKCISYYNSGTFSQDANGLDEYCRWCAEGGKLICCDFCHNAFCKDCIRRNFGRKELSHAMNSDKWSCYVCDSKPLVELKNLCNILLNRQKSSTRKKKKLPSDETNHSGKGNMIKELNNKGFDDENWLGNSLRKTHIAAKMLKSSAESLQSLLKKKPRDFQNSLVVSRKLLKSLNKTKFNIEVLTSEITKGLKTFENKIQTSAIESELKDNSEKKSNSNGEVCGPNLPINSIQHCSSSFDSPKPNEKEHLKSNTELEDDKSVNRNSSNKSLSSLISKTESEDSNGSEHISVKKNQNKKSNENLNLELSPEKDNKRAPSKNLSLKKKLKIENMKPVSKLKPTKDTPVSTPKKTSENNNELNIKKEQLNIEREIPNEKQNGNNKCPVDMYSDTIENVIKCFNQEISNEILKLNKKSGKESEEMGNTSCHSENEVDENLEKAIKIPTNCVNIKQEILENNVNDSKIEDTSELSKSELSSRKDNKKDSLVIIKKEALDVVATNHDEEFSDLNEKEYANKNGTNRVKIKTEILSEEEQCANEEDLNTNTINHVKIKTEVLSEEEQCTNDSLNDKDFKTNKSNHVKIKTKLLAEEEPSTNNDTLNDKNIKSKMNHVKIKMELPSEEEHYTNDISKDEKNNENANEIAKQKLLAEMKSDDSDSDDTYCPPSCRPRRKVTPKKVKQQDTSDDNLCSDSSDSLFSSSEGSESDSESVVKRFKTRKSESGSDDKLNMEVKIKLKRIEPQNSKSSLKCKNINASKRKSCASSDLDVDEEVDKLCNLASLKHKKRKRSSSQSEMETDDEVDKKNSKGSSSKLKSKKKRKDKNTVLDMSSESEESTKEEEEEEDVPMKSDDDIPTKEEIKIKGKSLNEVSKDLLKEELLKSSSSEDSQSDSEQKPKLGEVALLDDDCLQNDEEKTPTKKKAVNNEKSEEEEEEEEENNSGDSEDEKSKSKKKSRHPLLKVKLSESDSNEDEEEEEEEEATVSKKKKVASKDKTGKGRRRKAYITDSDEEVEFKSSEEDNDSESVKSGSSDGVRKTRRSKKAEEEKKANKKRRRIKELRSSSTDTEANSGDEKKKENKEDKGDTPGKGRKNIRKLMKDSNLKEETKAAAREEEERRQRVAERQKLYNELQTGGTGEFGCPIVTKLVLDKNLETEEELVAIHPDLITKLKPHQVQGVQFMWNAVCESIEQMQKHPGSGCILAHCMGLGKTLQVITFVHTVLSNHRTKLKTALVVCPLNTILNWANEFSVWLDSDELSLNVLEMSSAKTNNKRAEVLSSWQEDGGVLIMGYDMFRNLVQEKGKRGSKRQKEVFKTALIDPGPDIVVCDEGHILKNDNTALAKAMNRIRTKRRIVLTGTPLQNNLSEYHCMVQFVKPSLLGTRKEFQNRFMNPINNGQCADSTPHDFRLMKRRAHILHNLLDGCVQRRDYNVLTPFLPPKMEYVISIRLAEIQIKLYSHFLENFTRGKMSGCKGSGLFADYQALMKIWTHPHVLKLAEIRDENKAQYDSEDSFIDDESIESTSSEDSSDMKLDEPSSSKGRRGKKSSGDEVSGDEVINNWRTRRRGGTDEPLVPEPVVKEASKEWWTEFISEEEASKIELSGKLVLLLDILQECEAIGDKVLVFSQSLLSLDLIEEMLQRGEEFNANKAKITTTNCDYIGSWTRGLDYFRMDGSTGADLRKRCTESFNNEENNRARLFLISTRAGGLGINLVSANRVIIFDASWNPTHDVQSIFRVYRFGQKKPVYVYRFVAQGTMEEKIYDRQITKLSLACRVVDEQQIERHFNAADLQELYTFTPESNTKKLTPIVPKDRLLAELLQRQKEWISGYHEQDSLLENKQEEELSEEERKAAWAEYEAEKKGLISATGIGILFPTGGAIDINTIIEKIQEQWPGLTQEELNGKVSDVIVWLRQQQQHQQMQAYQQRQLYQQTLYQQQYQQQQYQLQQQQFQQQQQQLQQQQQQLQHQQLQQQQQDRLRQHHLSLLRSPNTWRGSLPTAGLPSQSSISNMYLDSNNSANPPMPSQGSLVPETPLVPSADLSQPTSAVLPSSDISNKDSPTKLL